MAFIPVLLACFPAPLRAQNPPLAEPGNPPARDQAPLDPQPDDTPAAPEADDPLADFPEFGVPWPTFDEPSATAERAREGPAEAGGAQQDDFFDGADIADPAFAEELGDPEEADVSAFSEFADERRYRVTIQGLPQGAAEAFYSRFNVLSVLRLHRKDGSNFAQLKRRAAADSPLIEQLLKNAGYYDVVVRNRFENIDAGANQGRINVIFSIIAGPQYRLAQVALPGLDNARSDDLPKLLNSFGIASDQVIDSDMIIAAQKNLEENLGNNGYPFAFIEQPTLEINHAEQKGNLTVPVQPGARYNFGTILLASDTLFDAKHVQNIARFQPGDLYNVEDVDDLRRALVATGLVSTVDIEPVPSGEEAEAVDLAIDVTQAPLRTIAGQLGFGTGEGLRAEVSWEHRNFFPPEGLIRLAAVVGTQEQSGSITFRRNNFRRRDQVLNGLVAFSNIDRQAFQAQTFSIAANIERQSNFIFQKEWTWSVGIELLASNETDISGQVLNSGSETFFIGALPATLTYDGSDSLLDPSSGFRLAGRLSPEISFEGGTFGYARAQVDASFYQKIRKNVVVAARTRWATISGASLNDIAPSRRLYAGGGASVRGFGFQRVGPRDVNNEPTGGRSLAEFSLEARVRLGNFGIVPFVDAGNVYEDNIPRLSGLRYGAGIGVRYYSNFGPIRVDIGTPINRQPGDNRIAVYVSLGQAF